jgi:RNA polymerase sigma-70 factor (ECF subfamily)
MTEAEFTAFYEASARRLRQFLTRALSDASLAEDLAQEAYIRFLNSRGAGLDAEEATRYLYRIAGNLVHDHWRRGGVKTEDLGAPETAIPPPRMEERDVQAALHELPPAQRSLLWLAYVEGYDHKEIAEIMKVKPASVKVLLSRARERFLKIFRSGVEMPR